MRKYWAVAALALVAGGAPVRSGAQAPSVPPRISTADFASLPLMRRPLLSPDGRRIVARATLKGQGRLLLLDADKPDGPARIFPLGPANIAAVRWAGNHRLLLTVQATQVLPFYGEVPYLRLIAMDIPSGQSRLVDKKSRGLLAGDVLYAHADGSWALVASQNSASTWPSVKRVDLATGDAVVVEKARDNVWDWYADDKGVVRGGIGYEGRRWTLWYRSAAGEPLKRTRGKFSKDDSTVDRVIFGPDSSGWIITDERTGRFGLYRYDFTSGAVGEAIFEHPEVDLENVTYEPFTSKVIAVNYQDDRYRTLWLDPERKTLQQKLDRALPDLVNMVVDSSDDDRRHLVWSGGASDPGRYFLLDRTTSRMHPVVDPYPQIDPGQLAPVKAVRYQARDGLSIPAYLTLPRGRVARGLPLIVMPHGGPFHRDEWSYDPFVQFLANRGYAVLQPQFRGSTGYGKSFVTRGYGEYGKKMQDDLDDGVEWLGKTGQIDAKRVCIFGMSYGGYAAMWGAIRNPERYRCAASWAGVSDLRSQLSYDRRFFSATRYYKEWRTRVGGEGKVDLRTVSPLSFADRLKIPILVGHGEKDATVPPKQSRAMVEALTKARAKVTPVFYKDSGHDFGSSDDLNDFLKRLEQFLAAHNPA